VVIVDEDGVVEKRERIENEPRRIEVFSNRLHNADMVLESSSSWFWLYEILSRRHRVVLSNPAKIKAIASARLKMDKVDALMLANLLRGGYIAESYVPSRRVMGLRELVRYRANLVRMRGTVKNRVHAYLLLKNTKIGYSQFTEGFFLRYQSLLVDPEGFLLGYEEASANVNEKLVEPLLDRPLGEDF
jgi:hypothetical protein